MTDADSSPTPIPPESPPPRSEGRMVLCPYCGHTQSQPTRCEACRGLFEPLSRKATQISMGPWFIRDTGNPFRPGCSYETLKRQVEAGRVTSMTVIRGPTTRQFWSLAKNVPGVAHLVGYCHRCEAQVRPSDPRCPSCGEPFGGMTRRNELGLMYPTPEAAEAARRELEQQRQGLAAPATPADGGGAEARPASNGAGGGAGSGGGGGGRGDLLEQVLQTGGGSGQAAAQAAPAVGAAAQAAGRAGESQGPASADAPAAGQALDFTPGPSAQATPTPTDTRSPEPAPTDAHRSSAVVWLLVLLNALAAAAVGLLAWLFVL